MKKLTGLTATLMAILLIGCAPKIRLFPDSTVPYEEYTLEGQGKAKILVLQAEGQISETPSTGLLRDRPGMIQELASQLRKAEADEDVRAVVLKINSPGGAVTASDILYHELKAYKERTGTKLVAVLMGLAASGGYYIALPADRIVAHPTTITGSVGVIFLQPKVEGLMNKIGLAVDVNKSGVNKDMGSPFRPTTAEEQKLLQDLTARLGQRFVELVETHRAPTPEALQTIRTARIVLAPEALALGLVDQIGYMTDALQAARELAGLPENARVVVYRRSAYPDDTVYNTATAEVGSGRPALVDLGLPLAPLATGFYYIWPQAIPR